MPPEFVSSRSVPPTQLFPQASGEPASFTKLFGAAPSSAEGFLQRKGSRNPAAVVGHLHVTGGTGPAPDIPKDRRGRSTSRPRLD
jgi:hypothetical protein